MGDLHGDPILSLLRCLFFKFAFGAVYTGTPVFSPLSMRCCFVLSLLGARSAPMFFVVFGRWGACLGLPSVGFVNAV